MSSYDSTVNPGENATVRDLAFRAAEPRPLETGRRYGWFNPSSGEIEQIDLTGEMPARKTGTVTVRDAASFARYWKRHSDEDSEVYADPDSTSVTAVLDAHHEGPNGARWGQHRLVLKLVYTRPWRTWFTQHRVWMSQAEFADFVEDNVRDIASASGDMHTADLLKMAQDASATVTASFGQGIRLATGEVKFAYEETVSTRAGRKGELEVPTQLTLAIAPFDDCSVKSIGARLRHKWSKDGGLSFCVVLDQPQQVVEDAVLDVTRKVSRLCGDQPVMYGTPA